MSDLPAISIVVPNLNGAATLRRALDSILSQGYAPLELVVVDGGSDDGSADILREYEARLAWWVSEKDTGQSDAINKGFAKSKGEIVNWLCSDDELLPGALEFVGQFFARRPDVDVLAAAGEIVYENAPRKNHVFTPRPELHGILPAYNSIHQQSCFWRRRAVKRDPVLDASYHYAMDAELWCHLRESGAFWAFSNKVLSRFVLSGANKTSTGGPKAAKELERIYRTYSRDRIPLSFWYRALRYPFERLLRRDRGPMRLAALRVIQVLYMAIFAPFYGLRRVRHMSWPE